MMNHATELAYSIYCIDIDYIRPRLACSYLMLNQGKAAFIDCGTSLSVGRLLSVLDSLDISIADVDYVIATHIHLDHAGGAGKLMQALPNAKLCVHPRGASHMIDPTRLVDSARQVYGVEAFNKLYGEIVPIDESRIQHMKHNDQILLNGRILSIADTPGHARHHICIYDELSHGWFTGDTFGLSYPDISISNGQYLLPTTTPTQFEPTAWLTTLNTLMNKKPERMYLTHFGEVSEVGKLAQKLKHDLQRYAEIAIEVSNEKVEHNRIKRLAEKVTEYTLSDLANLHCEQSREEIIALLKTDINLNAQGLDVWLSRQEKI